MQGRQRTRGSGRHFEPLEDRRLFAVVGSPIGFGNHAAGGAGGPVVTVTNAADFTTYATKSGAYTIQVQGTIDFGSVHVAPNKSILGLGTNATIKGDLGLYATSNVIVQNLTITNPSDGGEGDGVTIKNSTHDVWVDHCSFVDCPDGECDVTQQSDMVTISWCKFSYTKNTGHDFTVLIGSSDSATADLGKLHVTLHHNWWSTLAVERMPSVRYGRVHVFDNYYNSPGNNYCIRSRIAAEVLVENNSFENVKDPYYVYVTKGTTGKIHASGNQFVNTTGQIDDGNDTVFTPPYAYTLDKASAVKAEVTAGAGAGHLAAPPTPSHWWKLDEKSGLTASDSVGGVSGSLVNMETTDWTSGHTGGGLAFDGVNESVNLGNNLNVTKNFTISAWIKPTRVTGIQGIFGKVSGLDDKQYLLTLNNNRLNFQYERSGNNWYIQGGTIQANVWQHVAVTVDTNLKVTLYVNDKAVASGVAPAQTIATNSSLFIGKWGGTYNSRFFAGVIDDVKFYASALDAAAALI